MSETTIDNDDILGDIDLSTDSELVVPQTKNLIDNKSLIKKDVEESILPNKIIESVDATEVEKKVKKRMTKTKKDMPTPSEIKQMDDSEIVENAQSVPNEEVNKLYDEFMGILETNDKIISDKKEKIFCPTGIDVLDSVLGGSVDNGGLVIGGLSILVGSPGCGKSMIAMQAMAQAQKRLKNCCMTIYIDSEESTTTERLAMLGVNAPKIKPVTQLTLEKVFKVINNLCNFKDDRGMIDDPAVVVWDSIANTLTEREFEVEDVNQAIGYKARFLTHYLPQYIKKCSNYNIGLIAVNQLRDVISMGPYSAPRDLKMLSSHKSMPGGNSLKYNAFHLLEMKVKGIIDPEKPSCKYPFDGIEVVAVCAKNKQFRPNINVKLIGNFTRGFSNFWSNYSLLTDTKRMSVGAWNFLVNLPNEKFRTKDAVEKYKSGGVFKEAYDKEVKDAIQAEIVDKYEFDEKEEFI